MNAFWIASGFIGAVGWAILAARPAWAPVWMTRLAFGTTAVVCLTDALHRLAGALP